MQSILEKKRIGIFGSTGSIGLQTLSVIRENPDLFEVTILVAKDNAEMLVKQALEFKPLFVGIENKDKFNYVQNQLSKYEIKVLQKKEGIVELAQNENYDFMVAAIVGFDSLFSVYAAIKQKKTIGLANKESIVVAGNIIMDLIKKHDSRIVPIDSEQSAIFQCLAGEKDITSNIKQLILTASGGPFRGRKLNFLQNVRKEHALQHPIWKMGSKISIDSATLMNKGLEVIEAKWLFNCEANKIKVLVHPESIIHGIVAFNDGTYKALMHAPDMTIPIQFALSYPERIKNSIPEVNFNAINKLTLEEPDIKTFRCLQIAMDSLMMGGNKTCILNAANEEVVNAFLRGRIKFLDIPILIEEVINELPTDHNSTLEEYEYTDNLARLVTRKKIEKKHTNIF